VSAELAAADDTLKAVFSELPSFDMIVPALLRGGVAAARAECQLTPGMPVTPMLAKPTKGVGEVLTRLEGIAFTSEWKYDGERAQVHKMPGGGSGHRIFSRNHEETTGKYPDLATILSDAEHAGGDNWTPLDAAVKEDPAALEAVMADDVDAAIAASQSAYEESLKLFPAGVAASGLADFIIDGEVIAYDPETDALLPFQRLSNRARKNVTLENVKVPVVYAAFDLLYLHGQSLLQVPLEVRRTLLKRFFKEVPGKFRFAVGYDTFSGDTDALRAQLDAAVEGHCEGLMVKTLRDNATYEPSRRSLNWLKLKKDYMDGLTDSLDLVVVAGWYGKGKRTGTYGAYLLACYDEDEGEFQAITKVGTGFSDEALASHTAVFNTERDLVRSECPRNVRMSVNFRTVPDAWFEPKIVWEVKAADLSISPVYTAAIGRVDPAKGIALRFPRFLRVRDDKSAEQATNSAQVESMYRAQPLAGGSAAPGGDDDDGLGQYAD
jgi:DNA ligase-1